MSVWLDSSNGPPAKGVFGWLSSSLIVSSNSRTRSSSCKICSFYVVIVLCNCISSCTSASIGRFSNVEIRLFCILTILCRSSIFFIARVQSGLLLTFSFVYAGSFVEDVAAMNIQTYMHVANWKNVAIANSSTSTGDNLDMDPIFT